jgi:endonuclease YncB( thermonuclease family)
MNDKNRFNPARRSKNYAGLTLPQWIILALVFMLGSAALAATAAIVFNDKEIVQTEVALPAQAIEPLPLSQMIVPVAEPTATTVKEEEKEEPTASTQVPPGCGLADNESGLFAISVVLNGETIEVIKAAETVRVRLAGVQETEGTLAEKAVKKIEELSQGQTIRLLEATAGQNRAEGQTYYIFAGDRLINYELIRQGLALLTPDLPARGCAALLLEAEQQARAEKIGIWKPTPVPTRTFIPLVDINPGDQNGCDCSIRYVCSDFRTHDQAQSCYNACNDYHSKLDPDRDGIACENLP